MNHQRISLLRQFLAELIDQDPKAGETSLAPSFDMEEGMSRLAYLQHERAMFRRVSPLYKLEQGWRLEVDEPPNGAEFEGLETRLINVDGDLVYEWAYALDALGQLTGNGSQTQTVSKMQHVEGKWSRALAVSSTLPIAHLRPLFPCAWQKRTEVSNDGLFWSFCFLPEQDLGQTFWGKFRIRYVNGTVEEKTVWLRGLDRPHFLNPHFVLSEDQKILTHLARLPWSIDVKFEDGDSAYLEFPRAQRLVFPKRITWACLTDALDHDWILSTSSIDFLDF